MSLVISLVLLGLGIGQRTIWAPPESIVSQLDTATDSQLLVIPGTTMNTHDGRQSVVITGDGPITAVVGRDHDVLGWVGESAHAVAGIDESDALTLTEQSGSSDALPQLAGSDMWIEEHAGEGEVSFSIDLPVGYSIAIAGEPGTAAPADVRVEWPFDAKTPLFGPLITAGLVFLALALVLFLLALRRHRRRRGPQRRSHRELSRAGRRALARDAREGTPRGAVGPAQGALEAPSAEQAPTDVPDAVTTPDAADAPDGSEAPADDATTDRSRGTAERTAAPTGRRRFGMIALPIVAVVALTGCGPQYWPSGPSTPAATEEPTPTSLEDTLPPVALTENQFDRVLEETRTVTAAADEARDLEQVSTRVGGAVLDARTTNYEVRGLNGEVEPLPGIPDGDVQLILPQQTEVWPRTVMAVVAWQDEARAQSALVFEQADARSDYRLVYQTTLASGVQLPAVASPTIGAASLPGDTPLLQRRPTEITDAYADLLLRGDASEFAAWFREDGDTLRADLGRAAKDELIQRPEFALSVLEWGAAGDAPAPLMLVTNEGGALLATSFNETVRVTPKEEGVEISTSGAAASLAGVQETTAGIETTYQIQVLFAVPPADAPEGTQIQVVGYSQALLDANEVGQ
ncbi:hypothetical protein [Agrococcus sp. UYP10]|uniref:hypothetical protein n=1 Tax=Agrococcus sp. UYP10 TaxID=1756355 RepID=UPI003398D6EC